MILALEILLTVSAIYMLATGKPLPWGKKKDPSAAPPRSDWRFRLLGGSLLTFWIVVVVVALTAGVVYAIRHPELAPEELEKALAADLKWWGMGIEAAIVLVYTGIGALATSMILKRQRAQDAGLAHAEAGVE